MTEPFLGEVKMVSFDFAPRGWAGCNGQLLPINQNQALFALFGTTFGGDGRVNFALPNLQGRTPIHFGGNFSLGQQGGSPTQTLVASELPQHTHSVQATAGPASAAAPANNLLAVAPIYSSGAPNTALATPTSTTGGSQPHNNLQPYLVINFIVALQGIFPSRN